MEAFGIPLSDCIYDINLKLYNLPIKNSLCLWFVENTIFLIASVFTGSRLILSQW